MSKNKYVFFDQMERLWYRLNRAGFFAEEELLTWVAGENSLKLVSVVYGNNVKMRSWHE